MTKVHVALTTDTGPTAFRLEFVPTRRRADPSGLITLPASVSRDLDSTGQALVELAPTGPGWCWRVVEGHPAGDERHVQVPAPVFDEDDPDVEVPAEYADLVDVDHDTLDPAEEPTAAWYAALEELEERLSGSDGGGGLPDTASAETGDRLILVGPNKTPLWQEDRSGEPGLLLAGDDLNDLVTSGRYMLDLAVDATTPILNTPNNVQRGLVTVDSYDYDYGYYGAGVAHIQTFQYGATLWQRDGRTEEGTTVPRWQRWTSPADDLYKMGNRLTTVEQETPSFREARSKVALLVEGTRRTAGRYATIPYFDNPGDQPPFDIRGDAIIVIDEVLPGALVRPFGGRAVLHIIEGAEHLAVLGAADVRSSWSGTGPAKVTIDGSTVLAEPWDPGEVLYELADGVTDAPWAQEQLFAPGDIAQINRQSTLLGKYSLKLDLAVDLPTGPAVMLTFGDYSGNTGPHDVLALDIATAQLRVLYEEWDNEEIGQWRRLYRYAGGQATDADSRFVFSPSIDPTGNGQASIMTNWPDRGFKRIPVGPPGDETPGRLVHAYDNLALLQQDGQLRLTLTGTRLATDAERADKGYPDGGQPSVLIVWEALLDPAADLTDPANVVWTEVHADVPESADEYAYARSFHFDGVWLYMKAHAKTETAAESGRSSYWRFTVAGQQQWPELKAQWASFLAAGYDVEFLNSVGYYEPVGDGPAWTLTDYATTQHPSETLNQAMNEVYRWQPASHRSWALRYQLWPESDQQGNVTLAYSPVAAYGESVQFNNSDPATPSVGVPDAGLLTHMGPGDATVAMEYGGLKPLDLVHGVTFHWGYPGWNQEGERAATVVQFSDQQGRRTRLLCNSEGIWRSGASSAPQPGLLAQDG